jgi:cysteinyl-tRNA synthetase
MENKPTFLVGSGWHGNYKIRYWDKNWQNIIYGYLERLLNAGFDGV